MHGLRSRGLFFVRFVVCGLLGGRSSVRFRLGLGFSRCRRFLLGGELRRCFGWPSGAHRRLAQPLSQRSALRVDSSASEGPEGPCPTSRCGGGALKPTLRLRQATRSGSSHSSPSRGLRSRRCTGLRRMTLGTLVSTLTHGASNRPCTAAGCGPCGSTPATPRQRRPTHASVTYSRRGRPGCPSLLTCRRNGVRRRPRDGGGRGWPGRRAHLQHR